MSHEPVPADRIRRLNEVPVRPHARYVAYWMTAARRTRHNYALQHAVDWCADLGLGLVILEGLRVDYPWASDRLHAFVLGGMREHARRLADVPGLCYHPFVETRVSEGRGLLEQVARHAAVVVTDDYPAFFLPHMLEAAARKTGVPVEAVDGNGLVPMRRTSKVYPTAYAFRRYLQSELPESLGARPEAEPLERIRDVPKPSLPGEVAERWPSAAHILGEGGPDLGSLPIDHAVGAVDAAGGPAAARARLERFLVDGIDRYAEDRNHPSVEVTSGLSPYLHFGHISTHEVFARLTTRPLSACSTRMIEAQSSDRAPRSSASRDTSKSISGAKR